MRAAPLSMSNDVLRNSLTGAQRRAHSWGERDRVTFDPGKESIRIIHPECGDDEEFVLLGTLFDCQLTMHPCLQGLLNTCRPKIRALSSLDLVKGSRKGYVLSFDSLFATWPFW